MRIAVTSQNFKTITGHAGKSRRFLVYEVDAQGTAHEIERMDLPKELSLHEYHQDDHPLFTRNITHLVTQGAGKGFIDRLAQQGIEVYVTSEGDPKVVVHKIIAGQTLAPGLPHEHHHDHEDHEDEETKLEDETPAHKGIVLTEAAANRVRNYLAKRGKGIGVRLGVRTSGCSGLSYLLEFVDQPRESDLSFEDRGIRVFIDPKSIIYLDGTELDYVREGLSEGFKFHNPNVRHSCGCGESFAV